MKTILGILLLAVALLPSAGRADWLIDAFDDIAAWGPNSDGGNPPATALDPSGRSGSCIRMTYDDTGRGWGNIRRSLHVLPEATGLRFFVRVLRAAEGAAFHLWLLEQDGDAYPVRVRVNGKELCELDNTWQEVTVPFTAFRFDPRGNKKRQFMSIDRMLLGCNFADFEMCVDELQLSMKEVKPMDAPRTPDLTFAESAAGRLAVLCEPGFARQPSHADPARLATLLRDAGFAVTMLRAGDLCDPAVLTTANVDALVIPCAPLFPAAGREAFLAFLRQGGAFLSIGGYAFDELLVYTSEGWGHADPSVTAAVMDQRRNVTTWINTRIGEHGDTMKLKGEQLGVFDPSYLLAGAERIRACAGQFLLPEGWSAPCSPSGFAAVAMTGSNSPVFPDVYGRWIPLVEAVDAYERSRGPAGALVHNHAGPYPASSWAFFGVTDQDLFDGRLAELDKLFVSVARRLCRPCFLHGLATDLACYRQGESVKLSVAASVHDSVRASAKVRFEIAGQPVGDALRADGAVTMTWSSGRFTHDLYEVRCVLEIDGTTVDEARTGFVIWDEAQLRSGPDIGLARNYFTFRDVPTFLGGANQTGMMWYSANEDPLVWDEDFRSMNDHGLNMLRILHFSPFARDSERTKWPFSPLDLRNRPLDTQRKTDAIVQLAQKHNVIVFLTLHDWMGVDLTDDELAAQREWNTFWTKRYRDVPGMLYDVQNEPSVRPGTRPDLVQLAESWLAERHGSLEQARALWEGAGQPPEVDFAAKPAGWGDLRARDLDLFRAVLFNRWVKANVEGVRAGDPDALVTVGHLQTATAADKFLGAEHVDFTNTHFYGRVPPFRQTLKMSDRRFEGKSLSLGEFGSREAHDARTHGKIGDPADESVSYYLAVGHYALGMGASFVANWDWKDFRDCVFPWGINHADLVGKPVLKAFRNMSLLFRVIEPRYQPPELYLLVPDSHRFGPSTDQLHRAVMQAIEWLFDSNVPFGVINEWALERLPAEAKALVWPLPYCPDDATFGRVRAFVEKGGHLLTTGDMRFDASRKPTRAGRLSELGLRADHPPIQPFAAESKALPDTSVAGGTGSGRVCWVPRPLELDGRSSGPAVYRAFVESLPLRRFRVSPEGAAVHVFEVPTREGTALIAYNDGADAQRVAIEGTAAGETVVLELAAQRPGLVVVAAAGSVVAAESQGAVEVGGELVMQTTGHHAVLALDRRDLRASRSLLVLPFGIGQVTVPGPAAAPLVGEVGEFRAATWVRLAGAALASGTKLGLSVEGRDQWDMRLVTDPDLTASARKAAEKLLNRR